jgi:hypothetical protein
MHHLGAQLFARFELILEVVLLTVPLRLGRVDHDVFGR